MIARTLDLPDFHLFHRNHANFPWRSHADWFLQQMVRWGQCPPSIDIEATSDRVYRTDIFRAAAAEMGVACPEIDRLPPGAHGEPLVPAFEPVSQEFPAAFTFGRLSHEQVCDAARFSKAPPPRPPCWAPRAPRCRRVRSRRQRGRRPTR